MKKATFCGLIIVSLLVSFGFDGCTDSRVTNNQTAFDEQAQTEQNQRNLLATQPPPRLTWSMERDNLIKQKKLFNDRTVNFFMYVFIEGVADPVGYYLVNKVSSVDSQLTNTEQIVHPQNGHYLTVPSPSEDGSYGTNGNGVFGFTPEDIYIQTNMHYIVATVPLTFAHPVQRLAVINSAEAAQLLEQSKKVMSK